MELIKKFVFIILFFLGLYILIKFFKKILSKKQILFLSSRLKAKADWKFKKLCTKFKQKHHRNPTRDELFRITINASHITIRQKGRKGHLRRQKVRKYLLEKHKIVKEYVMK
jgi:hypothetical protein